jgi:hypothetical protein
MPTTTPEPSVATMLNRPQSPSRSRPPTHSTPLDIPPGSQVHVRDIRSGPTASRPAFTPSLAETGPILPTSPETGGQDDSISPSGERESGGKQSTKNSRRVRTEGT